MTVVQCHRLHRLGQQASTSCIRWRGIISISSPASTRLVASTATTAAHSSLSATGHGIGSYSGSHGPVPHKYLANRRRHTITTCNAVATAAATSLHSVDNNCHSFSTQGKTQDQTAPLQAAGKPTSGSDLPPIPSLLDDIEKASMWNHGNKNPTRRHGKKGPRWRVYFCRATAASYENYLMYLANASPQFTASSEDDTETNHRPDRILDPSVAERAFKVLIKCHWTPPELSAKVRFWERKLGVLGQTPLTDRLTLRLLEANGKAGNLGRVLSLLEYRLAQGFEPHKREFIWAVQSLEAAGWSLRTNRNPFFSDMEQPVTDNPTRWLDAILLNMHARKVPLTVSLAARMLDTYSATGRSSKAIHYFYSVHRTPLSHYYEDEDHYMDGEEDHDDDEFDSIESSFTREDRMASFRSQPVKVRLKLNPPPPYHKVPSEVDGNLVSQPTRKKRGKGDLETTTTSSPSLLQLDREMEPDWSLPLTSAFSFADSLEQGACGHPPITLDLICYNILIKACVYRGALWRATNLLETVMPSAGIQPDSRSYDMVLSGLSRVGDVLLIREYYQRMLAKDMEPSSYTVQYIVEGLLNLGDVAGAVTVVQDFFNQHSVLPPVRIQVKILEFALGLDQLYEAKRHVYFIQQLWKWQPHPPYDSEKLSSLMQRYQSHPLLSRNALQQLFAYFGETLDDSEFF